MAEKIPQSNQVPTYPTVTPFVAVPVTPQKDGAVPAPALAAAVPMTMPMTPPPHGSMPVPVPVPIREEDNSPRRRRHCFIVRTLKLFPFHILNFALGTAAFCVVITGLCLAGGLIPLCCLGLGIFVGLLFVVKWFAIVDVMLANFITPKSERVALHMPMTLNCSQELQLASDLHKVSWRSTLAIVYFLTIKFALGIVSITVVSMPFSLITGHVVYVSTGKDENTYTWGWNDRKFNWDTHPVWYTLAAIAMFFIGIALMHVVARLSQYCTRKMCCEQRPVVVMPQFVEPCAYASQV